MPRYRFVLSGVVETEANLPQLKFRGTEEEFDTMMQALVPPVDDTKCEWVALEIDPVTTTTVDPY